MRVGTRGSALALAQARWVADQLEDAELVTIATAGDRGEGLADKSRWTSALEGALLSGEIDAAVHSAKDVPGALAAGTVIAAIPARAGTLDALCGFPDFASIVPGARVGTSSIRRAAQLRSGRDDLEIVELRGNVDTRLRKLELGEVDAVVLAEAGLTRLGREGEIGCLLSEFVPAPGQGALLVQARAGDTATLARLRAINDESAERCVMAERALASSLNATCATPLGASAVASSAADVTLRAWIGLPDGSHWISDEHSGPAATIGAFVANRMRAAGASELLVQAERMATA